MCSSSRRRCAALTAKSVQLKVLILCLYIGIYPRNKIPDLVALYDTRPGNEMRLFCISVGRRPDRTAAQIHTKNLPRFVSRLTTTQTRLMKKTDAANSIFLQFIHWNNNLYNLFYTTDYVI